MSLIATWMLLAVGLAGILAADAVQDLRRTIDRVTWPWFTPIVSPDEDGQLVVEHHHSDEGCDFAVEF